MFYLDHHKHSFYEKLPIYAGCTLFNMLPDKLKICRSLNLIKKYLKLMLTVNCFYTVDVVNVVI